MALDLRLDTADVLGLRFARSPLWETMEALRTVREPSRQAYHLSWLRAVDLRAVEAAAAYLAPLVPQPGTGPDFLIPIPAGPTTDIDDDLATVAATPADLVERELRFCLQDRRAAPAVHAGVRALLAAPAASVARIVAAQRTCWEHLVRPFWAAIDDLLASDIAHRAAALATTGLGSVLNALHRDVGWADGVLAVRSRAHGASDDVRGRGLVLMPSVFGWPNVVAMTDPPWQPTLIYPARGVGTLWPPGPARDPGALGELLGASRARLLRELGEEASTSALARRLGLGLPTASGHLRVLRDAGLVTARRAGREVLHRRTALGSAVAGIPLRTRMESEPVSIRKTSERRVVAAILRRGHRALLCHRSPERSWYPDTWDLPGGGVEEGESPQQALVRELEEELGVRVTASTEPLAHVQGSDFRMDIWLIDKWSGEPENRAPDEHDELGWFDLGQARQLHVADPRLIGLLASVLE